MLSGRLRRALESGAQRLHASLQRAAQLTILLRSQRRLWLASVTAAGFSVALLAGGACWTCWSLKRSPAATDREQAWRYLLLCENCGQRTRTPEHPARRLSAKSGLLQCPHCGQFRASWYRRGSQSMPPGGWQATSRPP